MSIDPGVPDIDDLLSGLVPGTGLQKIADILAADNLTDLSSLSIVSHGDTGEITGPIRAMSKVCG